MPIDSDERQLGSLRSPQNLIDAEMLRRARGREMKTVQASVLGRRESSPSGSQWAFKLGLGVIFVIGIGIISYTLVRNDSYSVETSLFYVSGHEVAGEAAKLTLSREIHFLKTPEISFSSCRGTLRVGPRAATGQEKPTPTRASAESGPTVIAPPVHARFGNMDQFTKWLSEGLSTEEDVISRGTR